jgi:hypothetical protein
MNQISKPAIQTRLPIDDMVKLIKQHCVLSDVEVDAIVLWIVASYRINAYRVFSKLALISPEKRCGKSTTMEVINSLANEGLLVSNISKAALFRLTEEFQPTLLIDEADTTLKQGDAELTGLINSSHTKAGAKVIRCAGDTHAAKTFSTWMPMVLASIGDLPPTIMDRSIVVNLRRKKASEPTTEPDVDIVDQQTHLRDRIRAWCQAQEANLKAFTVSLPDVGNHRASDNWKPLFGVAGVMGGNWPSRCERAFTTLTEPAEPEESTLLLMHIKELFDVRLETRIASSDLVDSLCSDQTAPWCTHNSGRPITQNQVALILRPFGIKPKMIRFGSSPKRGYDSVYFQDAFDRYLS